MIRRLNFATLAALSLAACGDFFGQGPDPSRAGPLHGGGTGGSGGSKGGGGNGGSGSPADHCDPDDPLLWVLSQPRPACPYVVGCARAMCPTCEGNCPEYMGCIDACACDAACLADCSPIANANCAGCLQSLFACSAEQCRTEIAACDSGGNLPESIVTGVNALINDIAVDETHVYFSHTQGLGKVPKTGAAVATGLGAFEFLTGIEVAGDFIYLVDGGALKRISKDGATVDELVPPPLEMGSGLGIALDAEYVFYAVAASLLRAPIGGGSATELNTEWWNQGALSPTSLAVSATSVYYKTRPLNSEGDWDIRRVGRTAPPGPGTTIASGPIVGLVANDTKVYFTELSSNGLSTVLRVNELTPTTQEVTQLASQPADGGGGAALALDGTRLYFGSSAGLFSLSIPDKTTQTLFGASSPSAIALDDDYVYVVESMNGSIWRIAKN